MVRLEIELNKKRQTIEKKFDEEKKGPHGDTQRLISLQSEMEQLVHQCRIASLISAYILFMNNKDKSTTIGKIYMF
jgi:hypothetical protein